ncbi:NAD(P)/FAD-dependent oxidoreductase [Zavarzinia sp. CC-PAN008]|uniref:NAD(P)/FAD-dependent oxidoreductase n=1 Tax=Zavarzinia sp. CC-PAN008 TaxID=3243332 RepID=UPI003F742949
MSMSAYTPSYYTDSAVGVCGRPSLQEALDVDVGIVGGGYTGLSAALELAQRGYSVAVLEAERAGWGASGRNGGQMLDGLNPGMGKVEALVGRADARALWDMSVEAVTLVRERIARHAIACDFHPGAVLAATSRGHLAGLRAEAELLATRYDHQGRTMLDRHALAAHVRTERFHGGWYDSLSGHLHPLNLALGLAAAAEAAGARVFEHSRVTGVEAGPVVTLRTAGGVVRARHALLAGNAYLDRLDPGIRPKVMPVGTYVLATEPLGQERALDLLPSNVCISDTNFVLDYFRLSADWRMLFGGRVSYSTAEPLSLARSMRRRMLNTFPSLRDVRVHSVWGGLVAITMNRLPHFGRAAPNVYFAQGYSGHGIALANLGGKLVAEAIAGTAERFDVFARIPHRNFPGGRALRMPLLVAATLYSRMRDLAPI